MADPGTTEAGSILIVDDDEDVLVAGRLLLKRHFSSVDVCPDPGELPTRLAHARYDAILLDMNFGPGESSGEQGFRWLREILRIDGDAVVVLITAHGGVDVAVEAMKQGATDFITKPWQNEKLVATLSASVKLRRSRSRARQLEGAHAALAGDGSAREMLGDSPAMQRVRHMIERSAPTDANVLILGENGTGKELAARAIHEASARAGEIFMAVDVGAIAESLFESELFGHVKGAFTDARSDRVGRIAAANGGTLFLDEIGNIPRHLQAKLLSVLEQRTVQAVGATRSEPVDVRVIAATNLPRGELTSEAVFRQDLLFRLNTIEIELPPLRARTEDIEAIATHYCAYYARKYKQPTRGLSAQALAAMRTHAWPGNVRALRHAIERAVILSTGEVLEPADFQLETPTASPSSMAASAPERASMSGAEEGMSEALAPEDDLNLERRERETIHTALRRHGYNISQAAKALGLTRAALYRRMEKHGL